MQDATIIIENLLSYTLFLRDCEHFRSWILFSLKFKVWIPKIPLPSSSVLIQICCGWRVAMDLAANFQSFRRQSQKVENRFFMHFDKCTYIDNSFILWPGRYAWRMTNRHHITHPFCRKKFLAVRQMRSNQCCLLFWWWAGIVVVTSFFVYHTTIDSFVAHVYQIRGFIQRAIWKFVHVYAPF